MGKERGSASWARGSGAPRSATWVTRIQKHPPQSGVSTSSTSWYFVRRMAGSCRRELKNTHPGLSRFAQPQDRVVSHAGHTLRPGVRVFRHSMISWISMMQACLMRFFSLGERFSPRPQEEILELGFFLAHLLWSCSRDDVARHRRRSGPGCPQRCSPVWRRCTGL